MKRTVRYPPSIACYHTPPITTSTSQQILARMGLDYYTPSQFCHTHLPFYLLGRQCFLNPLWHHLLHILPHLRLLHRATHTRVAGHIGAGAPIVTGFWYVLFVLFGRVFVTLLRGDARVCVVGCVCSVGHGGQWRSLG